MPGCAGSIAEEWAGWLSPALWLVAGLDAGGLGRSWRCRFDRLTLEFSTGAQCQARRPGGVARRRARSSRGPSQRFP